MRLKEGEQNVDDVSSALKRFLRDLPDGLFTRAQRLAWLEASGRSCSRAQLETQATAPQLRIPSSPITHLVSQPTGCSPLLPLLLIPVGTLYRARVSWRWRILYPC